MTEQLLPLKRLRIDADTAGLKPPSKSPRAPALDSASPLPAAAGAATSPTTPTQPSAMASSSPPAYPQRGQPAQTPQQTLPTIPEIHERAEAGAHCPWPAARAFGAQPRSGDLEAAQQPCDSGLHQAPDGEMEAEGAEELAACAPRAAPAGGQRRHTARSAAAAELAGCHQYRLVLPLNNIIPAAVLSLQSPHAPPGQPPLQAGWAVVPFAAPPLPGSPPRGAGQLLPNGASSAMAAAHWHQLEREQAQKAIDMLQSRRQRKPQQVAADPAPMATDDGCPAGLSLQPRSALQDTRSTAAALVRGGSGGSSSSSSDSMQD